jgi:hypothetical protein
MNLMRALKGVWMGCALVAAWLAAPRLAWAQCADPCIVPTLTARTGGTSDQDARAPEFTPTGISYSDCIADVELTFSLQISNIPTGDTLQVWAGPYSGPSGSGSADGPCVFASSRQTECWPVVNGPITPEQPTSVTVSAQEAVLYLNGSSSPTYMRATSAACTQTSPGAIQIGIYFMFLAPDGSVDGTAGVYQLPVDTLGPFAPASVTLTIGDGNGTLNWTPPDDPTNSIVGYYVYCQNDGDAGTGLGSCSSTTIKNAFTTTPPTTVIDAGTAPVTSDASDLEAGFVFDAGAPVPVTPAGISEIPASFLCSPLVAGNAANSATLSALKNFDHYVFAVAAVDQLGNVGPVGNLVCGTPAPVAGFWNDYLDDGGLAGGGDCALEGVGVPAGGACMAIGVGLGAIGLSRRRKPRARRP